MGARGMIQRSPLGRRLVAAASIALGLGTAAGEAALPAQAALVNNFPTHYFAPYVDMGAWPTASLVQDSQNGHIRYYSLAFITSDAFVGGGCTAAWAGSIPLNQVPTYLPSLDSDIAALRASGGDVIVSFGGEAGTELAQACSSESALQAQYQSIIDQYHVSHIDFDIEGVAVNDTASIDLRNRALAALQAANPGLMISYTLPVLPTGLVDTGLALLRSAITAGVNVHVVNIMTMDYGGSFSSQMGQDAVQAGNSLFTQLKGLYPGRSDAQLWSMIGLTPMTGANDVGGETFTLQDAQTVLQYAQQHGITELAYWSVNRDTPAFSYAAIFSQFNGGAQPTPMPITPPGPPRSITAVANGAGQATVSWSAPADDGGSPVNYYALYAYSAAAGSGTMQVVAGTTATVTGLTPGSYYTFTSTGWNGRLWGAWGSWSAWMLAS